MTGAASSSPTVDPPARRIHVPQTEYAVVDDPSAVLFTILGSCVACCLRDPVRGVGGMNHFLLPGGQNESDPLSMRYGVNAMELLINGLLKRGARRDRLEAKLFGGARVLNHSADIGASNAQFALEFLKDEGVAHVGGSLGGSQARRVEFWPVSGRARQVLLQDRQNVFETETRFTRPAPVGVPSDDLELF
jgi:chemotaxis protein CheD